MRKRERDSSEHKKHQQTKRAVSSVTRKTTSPITILVLNENSFLPTYGGGYSQETYHFAKHISEKTLYTDFVISRSCRCHRCVTMRVCLLCYSSRERIFCHCHVGLCERAPLSRWFKIDSMQVHPAQGEYVTLHSSKITLRNSDSTRWSRVDPLMSQRTGKDPGTSCQN